MFYLATKRFYYHLAHQLNTTNGFISVLKTACFTTVFSFTSVSKTIAFITVLFNNQRKPMVLFAYWKPMDLLPFC